MKEYVAVYWIVLGEPDGCFPDRIAVVYVLYDVCGLSFIEYDWEFIFLTAGKYAIVSFVLFLLYFPENLKHAPHKPHSLHLDLPRNVERSTEWKISLAVAITCVVHLLVSVIITAVLLKTVGGPEHYATNLWASILGVLSMILAAFQYLPQIWKTWRRKVWPLFLNY
jgi:hypothetical protein